MCSPFQYRIAAFSAAVLAGMPELFHQVFLDLKSKQGAVLVLFTFNVRIFHQLGIEADSLKRAFRQVDPSAKPAYP